MSNAATDETELKPCPFCGGNAIRCGNNDINPRHWVMCRDCHACPGGDVPDLAAAETAWNSRETLTTQKDIQPVAWLRPGEYVPIQNCPYGAMWISDKDDPRAFPVYTNAPAAIDAIAIIEARLPLYTDIGQINALRECISSIRSAAPVHPPVQVPVVKALTETELSPRQLEAIKEALTFRLAGEVDSGIPAEVYDRALDKVTDLGRKLRASALEGE